MQLEDYAVSKASQLMGSSDNNLQDCDVIGSTSWSCGAELWKSFILEIVV